MTRALIVAAAATGWLLATPAAAPAQTQTQTQDATTEATDTRPVTMQYSRPLDQRGINVFETTKEAGTAFTGFKVDFGASFATDVQALQHQNAATPVIVNGVNTNELMRIGTGFNNSVANLVLQAQLAKGIRVQLTSYLSSRHHNETWVKDGYIQIDESPIDFVPLQALMQFVTVRFGQMEINYGDQHFRRSDNGNGIYNAFIGNYILDSFATEVAAEGYVKSKGFIAMAAITGGESRGTVLAPEKRSLAKIAKVGIDRQLKPDLRIRLTSSIYKTDKANSNTLYGGDRAGSRYYFVLENTAATESAQFTSGLLNPGFRNQVTAVVVNPFVKFRGLEAFGVLERSEGKAAAEAAERVWTQYAADLVYRFLPREQLFVGARYNRVAGPLAASLAEVTTRRVQLAGGWFITQNILMKAEYVDQRYEDFPATDIRSGGTFNGWMLEGAVGF